MTRIFLIFFIMTFSSLSCQAAGFFNEPNRYKGFFWFDHDFEKKETQVKKVPTTISPAEAREKVSRIKDELESAKEQMIALALTENVSPQDLRSAVINYRKLEQQSWDGANRLADAAMMVNFLEPELADEINNPSNVFAQKIKREQAARETTGIIRDFAKDFDLVLFAEDHCLFCNEFKPVANSFATMHRFSMEVLPLSGASGVIAKKLGISSVPTLVAVSKKGDKAIEISRGMISASELEQNIKLAATYVKENGATK